MKTSQTVTFEPGDIVYAINLKENIVRKVEITEQHLHYTDGWSRKLKPVVGTGTLDEPLIFNDDGYAYLNYHTVKSEGQGMGEHPVHSYSIDYKNIVFLDEAKAHEYVKQKTKAKRLATLKIEAHQEAVNNLAPRYKQMLDEEWERILVEKIKNDDLLNNMKE